MRWQQCCARCAEQQPEEAERCMEARASMRAKIVATDVLWQGGWGRSGEVRHAEMIGRG